MTINIEKQLVRFDPYDAVDLQELGLVATRLTIGYSHAAQLQLQFVAEDHTTPIERLAFIRMWDDGFTLDDGTTDQDATHPLFEGFVEVVAGSGPGAVAMTVYDPTYRATKQIIIMSTTWLPGPIEGEGAIPRLVYNVPDESDADYAFERGHTGTIGQIVAGLLEDQQEPLWHLNCCPGSGGSSLAYNSADLVGMNFIPQEKIVWESESIRAGVERLQRYEPRYRMVWHPGTRLWRYQDVTASPQVTLRLNDPTVDFPVLSMELTPSFDRCYTAIKIYGPPTTQTNEFTWLHPDVAPDGWTNTLLPIGSAFELELIGAHEIETYAAWQIVDATLRRGARLLPDWYSLRTSEYIWEQTKYPQFLLTWDGGNSWVGAAGNWLDFQLGIVTFPTTLPYATVEDQFGQTAQFIGQHYFPPNGAKLLWSSYLDAITVRVPPTGFEGTAFTVAGLELERKVYDEQLAIGFEYGQPVTSDARIAQMANLARAQLDNAKNMTWVGGCVLDGIDYSWCRLNRRVSFEVNDGSGGTTSAGWDAIDAIVTDVDYDYVQRTTTLTFSSDRAELVGEDVALIKQRLGIRALQQRAWSESTLMFRTSFDWRGNAYQELSGVSTTSGFDYVDPVTGLTVASD